MTGIAAIQARIGSIESRLGDLGLGPNAAPATGGDFEGLLNTLNAQAMAQGATSQRFFDYVPDGTKLATIPGTQAYAQAQAQTAAAMAAARQVAGISGVRGSVGTALASAVLGAGGLTGQQVVESAKKYLGVPYKWGGQSTSGMDCSGLVQRTFLDHGIKLPRTARGLMSAGVEVPSLAQAQPGDLIITRGGGHVAIYVGDNKIIHAPQAGEKVRIQQNYSSDAKIDTIRRIV